ncbi:serine/threonine-protein kinase [Actinoplanes sp. NBRC 103695]|uniref:serine/threonine-protein kinase n=1 Tax=Actinoplanes sp. NBRC 103695 TaxID=3032202 RepID=UPI0024A31749|nr:serine/threonine-protein kinase [Actinoplanes sp. NBRC 103695]GLY93268.1 serine/threonine protein kinase [Actinoplanes sp. NBRC 103695]
MAAVKCAWPGCAGSLDDTGYCETCYRPPFSGPEPAKAALFCGAACALSDTDGSFEVAGGLVRLPVLGRTDPRSRLLDEQDLVSAPRRCGKHGCTGVIGLSTADNPSGLDGRCSSCRTPFSFRPRLHEGDVVADQYRVLGPMAQSGFGWVFLAHDQHLDQKVVLKGLLNANDTRAAEMAVRERQYLTRLKHPNIVRILNAVTHAEHAAADRTGYIVMDYVDGPSLEEVRRTARVCGRDCGTLPLEHILGIGHEILSAMAFLHSQGLLYCDMKPANVMRGRDGITVVDLGGMSEIAAQDKHPVGTEGYQAPKAEIAEIGATVKSDIHALGRTLSKLYQDACQDREGVPPVATASFERLLDRAAEPNHLRRFASAGEMTEQLMGVLRELLSLRDGNEYAATSTLFAPTVELIDAGLGEVPALARWTATALPASVRNPPPLRSVALGLPIPRTDPADVAARYLGGGARHDPRDLIARLARDSEQSAELLLRGCRAHIELDDSESAKGCLADAEEILGETAGEWRLSWYLGLLAFAGGHIDAAAAEFTSVGAFWPGEVAPKLAVALCEERTGGAAEELFTAVWQRDRSQTSAAFGLARLRLRDGDRAGAARILDQVPPKSPHHDAAGIAAARAYAEPIPARPSAADVAEAARRLPGLRLDGGARVGEARYRMTALIRQAEAEAGPDDEPGAAARLERSYRELAAQARTATDHEILIDLANRVRPRTLLTWWR